MKKVLPQTTNGLSLQKTKSVAQTELPRSAYVHIPFCRRRCYYCDFPISVLGDKTNPNTSVSMQEYVEVLCQEIEIAPRLGQSLETIFFGGGTPSLLPVNALERILETLDRRFSITPDAEISIEIDPGTFDLEKLQGYQRSGVNRVSLGAQAFQDELLQVCGRSHSSKDIFVAIERVRQVGIAKFSLDLISGLPQQTLEQWQASLETALKIAPNHLSCYDLVLEPVTAFGKKYQPGENPLPSEEMTAQMYRLAQQMLTCAGYEHYEISNYAQSGYQCRHNRVYWENRAYYGFGMGAASYTQRQRFTRPRTRQEYYTWVQQLIKTDGVIDYPRTSTNDRLLETLMLGLRLAEGVNLVQIQSQFSEKIVQEILVVLRPYYRRGWVAIEGKRKKEKGKNLNAPWGEDFFTVEQIRLTDPEGFLFSNVVLAALFKQLIEE